MTQMALVVGMVIGALRTIFLFAAVVFALIALIDWAVRTRRVSPFSPVARFFRSAIDPLLAPIERRVVRAGGLPSSAPWWALAAVIIGGIIILSLLGFIDEQVRMASTAAEAGIRGVLALLIVWSFRILRTAIIVVVVCSWVSISPYSKWVRWAFVLTDPVLRPLRRVVPTIGMIDITPILLYFLLGLLQAFVLSLL